MNRIVKLYRSVKRPSGAWGTQPVPDNQLRTLKDLPKGEGNYHLGYYEGKHRQMPPVGRFADAAKQKLIQKRKELDAHATGVEIPPEAESEPKSESNLAAGIEKYLSQMMSFVGNDSYGRTKKSVNAYRNRLSFYLRFCTEKRITDLSLGDYDHLMEYVGWLRKQTKRNGKAISDRYVFNIFATLGTFALSLDITVPAKKILPKLGYKKKEVKAHTDRELQSLWASCMPDEELLYKFFLWSMGREQEVANTEVGDLDFTNNTVHICPKPHRNYRLKSKRNRNGNVGDRYVPIHASLMARLKEYIGRKKLREGDLLFPNLEGNVEGHYLRKLQDIVKRAALPGKWELHKLRKTGATLHYAGGKGVPLATISQWLGHSSLQMTEIYLDVKSTAPAQEHIQHMIGAGALASHV
jgi:integrase